MPFRNSPAASNSPAATSDFSASIAATSYFSAIRAATSDFSAIRAATSAEIQADIMVSEDSMRTLLRYTVVESGFFTTKKVTFHDMYNGTTFNFSCTFRVKDRAMLYPSPERWRKCSKMPNFVLLYI